MTEEEYAEVQRRGLAARGLLESEAFSAAFDALQAQLAREWIVSGPAMAVEREARYAEARGMLALKGRLQAWANRAKYEAAAREKRRGR